MIPGHSKETFLKIFIQFLFGIISLNITTCSHEMVSTARFSSPTSSASILRVKPQKLTSSVACSRNSLVTTVSFPKPFLGRIFAKGFGPDECTVIGNGSQLVYFKTNVNKCGIKVIKELNKYEMQLYLYVQHDLSIPWNYDERVFVRCVPPQEIVVSGSKLQLQSSLAYSPFETPFGHKSLSDNYHGGDDDQLETTKIVIKPMANHQFASSSFEKSIDAKMDILRGRIPFLKPIDSFVDIGDDVTILIQIKDVENIDSKISKCYAHDGTHSLRHSLTDDDGCTLDSLIMPNFKEFRSEDTRSRIIYSTFPAFKFPDKSSLHIQCSLIVCNTTCPKFDCPAARVVKLHPLGKRSISDHLGSSPFPSSETFSSFFPKFTIKHLINSDPNLMNNKKENVASSSMGVGSVLDEDMAYTGASGYTILSKSERPREGRKDGERRKMVLNEEEMMDEEDVTLLACITSPLLMIALAFVVSSLLATTTLSVCLSMKLKQAKKQLQLIARNDQTCASRALYIMDINQRQLLADYHHQGSNSSPTSSSPLSTITASLSSTCANSSSRKNGHHGLNMLSRDTDLVKSSSYNFE